MSLRVVALVLLVLGVAFMVPFEEWYTRLVGVLCLFGFVVCGVFAIATPEYLGRDLGDAEEADAARSHGGPPLGGSGRIPEIDGEARRRHP